MKDYRKIMPEDLKDNLFSLIGDAWMLVTAGLPEDHNTMTASWGTTGVLWNKKIAQCYVRPSRHTFKYMEKNSHFTLSFFDEDYRDMLSYCGTYSGRDVDKAQVNSLTPFAVGAGTSFNEASLIVLCRKIYIQDLEPEHFLDPAIMSNFPNGDYHRMYTGEIEYLLQR
jgi:flavin reductase (DIM6/NTAB) family NADH-FMN oxidoreductase RutF